MAGRGVGDLARVRVDATARRPWPSRPRPTCRTSRRSTSPGEATSYGVGAEGAAQPAHQGRGGDAAAGDVADGHHHDAVGPDDDVVPVAADLEPGAARLVAGREVERRRPRGRASESRLRCSVDRDGVLALLHPRPLEGARGLLGVRGDQRLLVGGRARARCRTGARARRCAAPRRSSAAAGRPSRRRRRTAASSSRGAGGSRPRVSTATTRADGLGQRRDAVEDVLPLGEPLRQRPVRARRHGAAGRRRRRSARSRRARPGRPPRAPRRRRRTTSLTAVVAPSVRASSLRSSSRTRRRSRVAPGPQEHARRAARSPARRRRRSAPARAASARRALGEDGRRASGRWRASSRPPATLA